LFYYKIIVIYFYAFIYANTKKLLHIIHGSFNKYIMFVNFYVILLKAFWILGYVVDNSGSHLIIFSSQILIDKCIAMEAKKTTCRHYL